MTQTDRIEIVATVASEWCDPEHRPRQEATQAALAADNRFTEGAIVYTLNHWMHACTPEALDAVIAEVPDTDPPGWVGVRHGAERPAEGLAEACLLLASGYGYAGRLSETAAALVPAVMDSIRALWPRAPIRMATDDAVLNGAGSVIAKKESPSISLIDGNETGTEREGWAEDALLYEGQGRSVSVVFAPHGLNPDPYFEALAQFRGVVPAHDDTPGALQMQQAFLEAQEAPYACADDLSFLVSRGAPEVHASAHLRWVPYETLDEVTDWITTHAAKWHAVTVRSHLHDHLSLPLPVYEPGTLHRPSLEAVARSVADGLR